MREIVAHIAERRAAKGERLPEGSTYTMRGIEFYINKHRLKKGQIPIDFSSYKPGVGVTVGDAKAVLEEEFDVDVQRVPTVDQIPDALQEGPVLAAVGPTSSAHAVVIVGEAGPDSYYVYDPLSGVKRVERINKLDITRAKSKDKAGNVVAMPVIYATRPRKMGQ